MPPCLPTQAPGPHAPPAGAQGRLPADYELLAAQAGCTSFTQVPLSFGRTLHGTLMLACQGAGQPLLETRCASQELQRARRGFRGRVGVGVCCYLGGLMHGAWACDVQPTWFCGGAWSFWSPEAAWSFGARATDRCWMLAIACTLYQKHRRGWLPGWHPMLPCATLPVRRWLAAFWPFLAMYLAESGAVRLCNMLEKLQMADSVNALAWTATSSLDSWFECEALPGGGGGLERMYGGGV